MSYSVVKGVSAATLLALHDQGKFSYDDHVSHYWPEFGANGKSSMTIAEAISHRGGMVGARIMGGGSIIGQVWSYLWGGAEEAWGAGLRFIEDYTPEWEVYN